MWCNCKVSLSKFQHSMVNPSVGLLNRQRPRGRYLGVKFYYTSEAAARCNDDNERVGETTLTSNLANLVEESSSRSAHKFVRDHNSEKYVRLASGETTLARNLASSVKESSSYSSKRLVRDDNCEKAVGLAKDLAFLIEESCDQEMKPEKRTRVELKRALERRIKKKVKEQYLNGKFLDLMRKVIGDPKTLKDAYDCIRVNSNVDSGLDGDNLPFELIAEELCRGEFDVCSNTYSISTRGKKTVPVKEVLVFPNLRLRVVQEAIRIVLEVVYRPHFSKISHGGRSGRNHSSALKYIRKEIVDPDWWFTLLISKKLDNCVLTKLISTMEDKIEDPILYATIRSMFDAGVLNLEFGGFPKGHGLPQEGVLSPILMNIYLDLLDREVYGISMRHEVFDEAQAKGDRASSKLRGWFRRQITGNSVQKSSTVPKSGVRVHCCRYMDEIFFAISGPNEVALAFKSEIEIYIKDSLYLEVNQTDVLASTGPSGVQFLGSLVKRHLKESPAVRAVHKLKEKVKLFAAQKQEAWDEGAVRIGKKWLAHGLKKVKESEIKQLADSNSLISQISCFRKAGMETDHWYKVLLKIWIQDVNAKTAASEEMILAKHIAEPALPQELRDSFYEFQKCAEKYVSSETASTLSLLSSSTSSSESLSVTEILAPVNNIKKRLFRYGLINTRGYASTCHVLMLQDDNHIVDWFSGLVFRWLRWYREFDNFSEVKSMISDQVRMSCIRTLAAKYKIHESIIEKKFDSELSRIPSVEELENEITNVELSHQELLYDDASMYGISYSGLCLLSLARTVSQSRPCNCFVMGCSNAAPQVYTLHVMERQKFPGWKTGFSNCIHPSLNRRRIGLCRQHLKDLFIGNISLQSINFGAWR